MKIAVISGAHIPSYWAHSINVMKHAQGFYNLNHEVEIFSVLRFKELILKSKILDIHSFYDINRNIKLNFFKDFSPFFFKESNKILELFVRYLNKFFPKLKGILDPEKKIILSCRMKNFDLVYCRTYDGAYYSILNKLPTILETHTNIIEKKDLQKLFKLSKCKYFKGIITINEKLKKKYSKAGVSSDKILVLEDAVDLEKFDNVKDNKYELRHEIGLCSNKSIVLYSGSLKPGKGIGKILDTAKRFDNNIIFYIVGGQPMNVKYWKKIAKQKKLNNVIFLGYFINKFIPKYLKSADILFMPYDLNEKRIFDLSTTSPLKLFEYMASKRPIVSLKISTIEKVVQDKKEALLAESDNANSYYALIQSLLKDKSLSKQLANNAYNRVKEFTYRNRCKKIIEKFGK